uniref:HDC15763 n=1 Tax=Drosophila melanogaster TaxID=7227 RepID=Q6IJ69_DROME|nr:TPA_inf: HDC15763 [Drosophila melanogaster]
MPIHRHTGSGHLGRTRLPRQKCRTLCLFWCRFSGLKRRSWSGSLLVSFPKLPYAPRMPPCATNVNRRLEHFRLIVVVVIRIRTLIPILTAHRPSPIAHRPSPIAHRPSPIMPIVGHSSSQERGNGLQLWSG